MPSPWDTVYYCADLKESDGRSRSQTPKQSVRKCKKRGGVSPAILKRCLHFRTKLYRGGNADHDRPQLPLRFRGGPSANSTNARPGRQVSFASTQPLTCHFRGGNLLGASGYLEGSSFVDRLAANVVRGRGEGANVSDYIAVVV